MHVPVGVKIKVPSFINFKLEKVIVPLVVVPDIIPCIEFVGETDNEIVFDPEVSSELQLTLLCVSTTIVKISSVVEGYIKNTIAELNCIHK